MKEGRVVSYLFVLVHVYRASGYVFQRIDLLIPVVMFLFRVQIEKSGRCNTSLCNSSLYSYFI